MSKSDYELDPARRERYEINELKKHLEILRSLAKSVENRIKRKREYLMETLQGQMDLGL